MHTSVLDLQMGFLHAPQIHVYALHNLMDVTRSLPEANELGASARFSLCCISAFLCDHRSMVMSVSALWCFAPKKTRIRQRAKR